MNGRSWPSLRLLEVAPPTDAQRLKSLVRKLEAAGEIRADDRRSAAGYLRRLANSDQALQTLNATIGRPRSDAAYDIALDYLIRRELLGKAEAAVRETAQAWSRRPSTVKDTFTECKGAARYRLADLVDQRVGTIRGRRKQSDGSYIEQSWTRRELLEAVLNDLQRFRQAGSAQKKSRKKSG